jgi:chaperonin GroEL (HSP60 family)
MDKMLIDSLGRARAVAIFIRAGLERMIDEAERSLNDALYVIADVTETPKMVAGGGSIEVELSKAARAYATQEGGREQLAIEAFADALEIIPRTLAENAGLDTLDTMVAIRSAHDKKKGVAMGVNVFGEGVIDMLKVGVVEPTVVKKQAIESAVEVASMVLRIDDVVAATSPNMGGGPTGGMPDMDEEM